MVKMSTILNQVESIVWDLVMSDGSDPESLNPRALEGEALRRISTAYGDEVARNPRVVNHLRDQIRDHLIAAANP